VADLRPQPDTTTTPYVGMPGTDLSARMATPAASYRIRRAL